MSAADLSFIVGGINVVSAGVVATAAFLIIRANSRKTSNRVAAGTLLFFTSYIISDLLVNLAPSLEMAEEQLRLNIALLVASALVIPLFPSYFPRPRLLARHPSLLGFFAVPLAVGWAAVAFSPHLFFTEVQLYYYGYDWFESKGPFGHIWTVFQIGGGLFGLGALSHSYLRAVSEIERNQARHILLAWGIPAIVGTVYLSLQPIFPVFPSPMPLAFGIAMIPFFYGVLKYQLLEIELKFKKGLRLSLLTASLTGCFIVGEQFLGLILGGIFTGGSSYLTVIGSGIMTSVFFGRLKDYCTKGVDRLLPGVGQNPSYLDRRRSELFRALLHEMYFSGKIDRTMLTRFAEGLGISEESRLSLEEQVRREHGRGGPDSQPASGL